MLDNISRYNKDSSRRVFLSRQEMLPSPEFKEKLLRRMRDKIRDQATKTTPQPSPWRKYIRVRIPLAAAACLLVAFGCLWIFFGNTNTALADFGDMLHQIRQALSVAYTASLQIPGESVENVQVYYINSGQIRQVWPDGRIDIINAESKKYLTITPSEKRAAFRRFNAQYACYTTPLDTLKQAADTAGEYIRDEEINGRKVSVYQLLCEDVFMVIWVDQERQLPVQIQQNIPLANGTKAIYLLKNFQWNIPIDHSQFAFLIPEGYTLEDTSQKASKNDLVFLLQFIAEINGGFFPENLSPETVIRAIYRRNDSSTIKETEEGTFVSKTDQDTKKIGRKCFKGLAFIKKLKQDANWHYVGKGVKLGDDTSIVCYWNSPGASTFQVILGNLVAKEFPTKDMASIMQKYHINK